MPLMRFFRVGGVSFLPEIGKGAARVWLAGRSGGFPGSVTEGKCTRTVLGRTAKKMRRLKAIGGMREGCCFIYYTKIKNFFI